MNLSLILNMPAGAAQANPANANPVQGQIPVEVASFQDFLALMGLSPLALADGEDQPMGDAAVSDPAALAAMLAQDTGNSLPPPMPVLPDAAAVPVDPALLVPFTAPAPVATTVPSATEFSSGTQPRGVPAIPLALQAPVAPVTPELLAAAVADAVVPARSARPQAAPAQATSAFDLPLPAASQAQPQAPTQQAAAQPVLAQLLQANARPAPRKGGEEATIATTSAVDAADLPAEGSRASTPAPILPVMSPAAIAAATPDALAAQPIAAAAPAPAATAERHDFTAVIDKLVEARELARPGRADMHLAHREFGQVSVQFELAGQALKVAMTSADPGFAPAVQAALADRPVAAAADAARADNQPQRADTVTASAASWQAGPQADGQRQDNQGRAQQARADNAPVRTNEGDADSASARAADRDGSRFA